MNLVLGTAVALWSVFSWYAALTRLSFRLRVNHFGCRISPCSPAGRLRKIYDNTWPSTDGAKSWS